MNLDTAAIDSLFESWNSDTTPGCAVAIVKGSETIYSNFFGMANLELNTPITPDSTFFTASVSKMFTGAAIALLEEENKLSLNDTLDQYFPDLPSHYHSITVAHLLYHTSGIRCYLSLEYLAGKTLEHIWKVADAYKIIKCQKSLNHAPGEKFAYSNSGYFLLGLIVKEVSGLTLHEFVSQNIFAPLKINNTLYKHDYRMLIPNRVNGYTYTKENGYLNAFHNMETIGDGGLYSTLNDMVLWAGNYFDNKLGTGSQTLIDRLYTVGKLNNGESANYAYGLMTSTYAGHRLIYHGGFLEGARTTVTLLPDKELAIICLANCTSFNPDEKCHEIINILFEETTANDLTEKNNSSKALSITQEQLEKYVGIYHDKNDVFRRVELRDSKLFLPLSEDVGVTFKPLSSNYFGAEEFEFRIRFSEDDEGMLVMTIENDFGPSQEFSLITTEQLTKDQLHSYTGRFYSEELFTELTVSHDNEFLTIEQPRVETKEIIPTAKDKFNYYSLDYTFKRNSSGDVTELELYLPRTGTISFSKLQ